jgi:hypothetical protein
MAIPPHPHLACAVVAKFDALILHHKEPPPPYLDDLHVTALPGPAADPAIQGNGAQPLVLGHLRQR